MTSDGVSDFADPDESGLSQIIYAPNSFSSKFFAENVRQELASPL